MSELTQGGAPFLEWAVAFATRQGEQESGDVCSVLRTRAGLMVVVVDGLGHGPEAAMAARRAAATAADHAEDSIIGVVRRCHQALIGTRGVVMSVAAFNSADNTMSWLGIGNIEGILLRADTQAVPRQEAILIRGGVVGLRLPLLQATLTTLATGDIVAFATDGVRPEFVERLSLNQPPQRLADQLLGEYGRSTDDALVFVGRYLNGTSGHQ